MENIILLPVFDNSIWVEWNFPEASIRFPRYSYFRTFSNLYPFRCKESHRTMWLLYRKDKGIQYDVVCSVNLHIDWLVFNPNLQLCDFKIIGIVLKLGSETCCVQPKRAEQDVKFLFVYRRYNICNI